MRRPSFQFYPADWRADVELRSCSVAARGLWIDLMCLAHECEPYGHLIVNGRAMTAAQIAGQIGLTQAECKRLLQELIDNGVARVNEAGAVYSKRMVADEEFRQKRAEIGRANGNLGSEFGHLGSEHGKKGGRPRKQSPADNPGGNGDENPGTEPGEKPPQNPRPSSSSSSASSNTPPTPRRGRGGSVHDFPPGFDALWAEYPKKRDKDQAARAFAKLRPDEALQALLIAAVRQQRDSAEWAKENGRFVPHLSTWLSRRRWEDEPSKPERDIFAGAL